MISSSSAVLYRVSVPQPGANLGRSLTILGRLLSLHDCLNEVRTTSDLFCPSDASDLSFL